MRCVSASFYSTPTLVSEDASLLEDVPTLIKIMAIMNRVSLKFVELSDPALDEFAANIVSCVTGNANFPTLTISPTELDVLRVNYHNALIAASDGGTQLKAVKNEARLALEAALRQDAADVQSIAGQNLAVLLTSGYKPVSTNRTSERLATPVILNVDNQSTSRLFADLGSLSNAAAYQLKALTSQGVVVATVESTRSKKIEIPGTTPGTVYTLQGRGIGGSTGYSDWSLPVSIMST